MEKKFNTKVIVEISIFAAIAFVLDLLQGAIFDLTPLFPNGGSIGIAMVPIMIIACRRGVLAGSLCGLATGIIQMLGGVSTIPVTEAWYNLFLQVLLDYTLTYFACGLFTGLVMLFYKDSMSKGSKISIIMIAAFAGGLGKFLCHFASGCIYWQSFDFGAPWVYSLLYNGSYILPSTIICMILVLLIYLKQPKIIFETEVAA